MAGASDVLCLLGFESISMAVDEIKEPQKCSTRDCVVSIHCNSSLYISDIGFGQGLVHYSQLDVSRCSRFRPRSVRPAGRLIMSVVAILTLITVCISMTYALSRMIYSIARDGLLPKSFRKLTATSRVPKMLRFWWE